MFGYKHAPNLLSFSDHLAMELKFRERQKFSSPAFLQPTLKTVIYCKHKNQNGSYDLKRLQQQYNTRKYNASPSNLCTNKIPILNQSGKMYTTMAKNTQISDRYIEIVTDDITEKSDIITNNQCQTLQKIIVNGVAISNPIDICREMRSFFKQKYDNNTSLNKAPFFFRGYSDYQTQKMKN
ncbi:hypothetical protein PPYR_06551 [Photinus pyralis]|uniref:Uncharacterized protein n=1 Tax=Photinus pyralis TaxID=7054 RepID=A0A5N4ATW0_PHOPY|nr:hypothetical protein PPYR_06551 [Photinus pyralis]